MKIPFPGLTVTLIGDKPSEVHKYAAWVINRYRWGAIFAFGTACGWAVSMVHFGSFLNERLRPLLAIFG